MAEETYLFIVSMDVEPEKEALFNEVYDEEHVPYLSNVPGVVSVRRMVKQETKITLGGKIETMDVSAQAKNTAIYEVTSPDVLTSDAWAEAGEKGRWAAEVRPFTTNRSHVLRKVIS